MIETIATATLPARLLARVLDQIASDISERAYCAGWMSGLEDALEKSVPEAITSGQPQPYGQDEIEVDEAQTIMAIVIALGGWKAAWEVER